VKRLRALCGSLGAKHNDITGIFKSQSQKSLKDLMAALSLEEEETHGDFHGCLSHRQVLSRRTYDPHAIAEGLNARSADAS
jgi:hypothetical protein